MEIGGHIVSTETRVSFLLSVCVLNLSDLFSSRQSEVLPLGPSGRGDCEQEDTDHHQEVSRAIDTQAHACRPLPAKLLGKRKLFFALPDL